MSIYVAPRSPAPVEAPVEEKAILGPGAANMMTLQPLQSILQDPRQMMRMYARLYHTDRWVYKAEQTIDFAMSTVDWHLEDGKENEIEPGMAGPAGDALAFLEKPQAALAPGEGQGDDHQPMTRAQLWGLTARHTGLCGSAFWLLDQMEMLGKTPKAALYIRPDRMTPAEDDNGNLTGWVLDYQDARRPGIPLQLSEVVHFKLNEPDTGHYGIGNAESASAATMLTRLSDGHAADVLQAGGRLTGIVSARAGGPSIPDGVFQQLVRDFRTITDSGDAAKRVLVTQGQIDFTRMGATPLELSLIELMKMSRDDTLAHWGVPLSQIGGSSPAGLNSGDVRKYDRAALWQNAIHPRLFAFWEVVQYQILDRWQKLGTVVELKIEEPEFDDDSPRYDLLQKSVNLPMRNSERRALIGLDPFGDPALDDAVWLPATLVQIASTGEPEAPSPTQQALGRAQPDQAQGEDAATEAAGETTQGQTAAKARLNPMARSMASLRTNLAKRVAPAIEASVGRFLRAQRSEIAAHLRTLPAYRAKDPAHLWPKRLADDWDKRLTAALRPHVAAIAETVSGHVGELRPTGKAGPMTPVVDRVLRKGAARVTAINQATRDALVAIVADGIEAGLSMSDLADALESGSDLTPLIGRSGGVLGDLSYRSEMIARTETMNAYNSAALVSYEDLGATEVEAIDGDDDPECAERNGQVVSIEEADGIEDHPNGTLDWVPVMPEKATQDDGLRALAVSVMALATRENPAPVVNVTTPEVTVFAPPINVTPAPVTISRGAVQVTVEKASTSKRVIRDAEGRITGLEED